MRKIINGISQNKQIMEFLSGTNFVIIYAYFMCMYLVHEITSCCCNHIDKRPYIGTCTYMLYVICSNLYTQDDRATLGEPVSEFGSQFIKLKMYNSIIFYSKNRTKGHTSTTSESTCLCPIIVQFQFQHNSTKSLQTKYYHEHKVLVLTIDSFVKGFD